MHLVSRRTFLETSAAVGGGLLLGFRLPPLAPLQQNGPFVPNAFVRIDRDGRVTLIMHKVEMGQGTYTSMRSEEHTSELQSRLHLVCRLLLEKKKKKKKYMIN